MTYEKRQKKKSQFTSDNTISNDSTFDYVKSGINKKTTWSNILDKVADVYGLSARIFDTESELVASDIAIGEYAIVAENGYTLYSIGNIAAATGDVTLTSGFIATFSARLQKDYDDYTELRALKSSAIPDGTVITVTNDGIAGQFVVKTGTVTDNGGTLIVATDDSNRYYERINYDVLDIEMFGAVENTDSSSEIRSALTFAAGKPVRIQSKRYIYDETIIATDSVNIIGDRMPNSNAAMTTLENGSIIQGRLRLTGKNIRIRNLGIDRGSANFSSGTGDCLVLASNGLDAGETAVVENVIALGRDKTLLFHGILIEGYVETHVNNAVGLKNYFCHAYKMTRGNVTNLIANEYGKDGIIFKGDNAAGSLVDFNASNMTCIGGVTAANGVRVRAEAAQIERINISNINVSGPNSRVLYIDSDGSLSGSVINELNISNVNGSDSDADSILLAGNIFSCNLSNINLAEVERVVNTLQSGSDVISHLSINGLYGSLASSSTSANTSIQVDTSVLSTSFDNITLVSNRSMTSPVGITYGNAGSRNNIGNHNCYLYGVGVPNHGFSEPDVVGVNIKVSLVYDRKNRRSYLKCTTSGGAADIGSISSLITGSQEVPTGYICTIANNSVNNLTLNHAGSPGADDLQMRSGASIVLTQSQSASFIFNGFFWTDI